MGHNSRPIEISYAAGSEPASDIQLVDTVRLQEVMKIPSPKPTIIGLQLSPRGCVTGEVYCSAKGSYALPVETIPVENYLAQSDAYLSPELVKEAYAVSENLRNLRGRVAPGRHGRLDAAAWQAETTVIPPTGGHSR